MLAQNRVLELDGKGSYVELPLNIFTNFTEATVEGWVKWGNISQSMKVFGFGRPGMSMRLTRGNRVDQDLRFGIGTAFQPNQMLDALNIIPTEAWFHFAAASGPGGMRLYFNGSIEASNAYTGSISALGSNDQNSFGLGYALAQPVYFHGQLDEMRVWKVARTVAQIRNTMFQRLAGKEESLVGHWDFNDGTANDASANAHHGKLMCGAKIVEARRPTAFELTSPTLLQGTVTNANETVLPNTSII